MRRFEAVAYIAPRELGYGFSERVNRLPPTIPLTVLQAHRRKSDSLGKITAGELV
jgi:hypothetical protein